MEEVNGLSFEHAIDDLMRTMQIVYKRFFVDDARESYAWHETKKVWAKALSGFGGGEIGEALGLYTAKEEYPNLARFIGVVGSLKAQDSKEKVLGDDKDLFDRFLTEDVKRKLHEEAKEALNINELTLEIRQGSRWRSTIDRLIEKYRIRLDSTEGNEMLQRIREESDMIAREPLEVLVDDIDGRKVFVRKVLADWLFENNFKLGQVKIGSQSFDSLIKKMVVRPP